MIRRKPLRGGREMRVTFAVPDDGLNGEVVAVVGDFNDWDPYATPLRKEGDLRAATVTLPAGRRYVFRYLAEGGQWFNEGDADDFQPNEFGGHDCVLDLSQAS